MRDHSKVTKTAREVGRSKSVYSVFTMSFIQVPLKPSSSTEDKCRRGKDNVENLNGQSV